MSDLENVVKSAFSRDDLSSTSALQTWDRDIAPILRSIEEYATFIEHYTHAMRATLPNLQRAIRALPERPEWETKARWQLAQSAETLQLTLALCRAAMEAYDLKPIMAKMLQAAE